MTQKTLAILPYDDNEDGLEIAEQSASGISSVIGRLNYYGSDDENAERDMERAQQIVRACNAYESLVKHLRWINDIVGASCDGGDAWCAVRDWPGASDWHKGMGELLESLGFSAKAKSRQANKPIYDGQAEICGAKADDVEAMAAENRARADLIEAEAEAAYQQSTGQEPPTQT